MKAREVIPFWRWKLYIHDWTRFRKFIRHPISAYKVKRMMWEIKQHRQEWHNG